MASGFGAFGGEGAYKFFQTFKECMKNTDDKFTCVGSLGRRVRPLAPTAPSTPPPRRPSGVLRVACTTRRSSARRNEVEAHSRRRGQGNSGHGDARDLLAGLAARVVSGFLSVLRRAGLGTRGAGSTRRGFWDFPHQIWPPPAARSCAGRREQAPARRASASSSRDTQSATE